MSNSGVGAADVGTAVHEYNTRDFQIQQALASIRVAVPVEIVRAPYDANGNTIPPGTAGPIGYVDVHPLVNQLDGDGNATPHGTVYRVSYVRNQGGNGAIINDPTVGDIGQLVVHDRDTSVVRSTNAQANPGSRRKFDLADGVYHGQPQAGAPKQYLAFLEKGFNFVDAWGNTLVGTANGVVINGATITLAGDVIAKNKVSLENHVHDKVTAGSDDSGEPVVP